MTGPTSLTLASDLIDAGHNAEAITLLKELTTTDPADSRPWALMSYAVDDPVERRRCLEQVIRLSDGDHTAADWARRQLIALRTSRPTRPRVDLYSAFVDPSPIEPPPFMTAIPRAVVKRPPASRLMWLVVFVMLGVGFVLATGSLLLLVLPR